MPRRILILTPSMAGVGGAERMVHALSGLFTKMGLEVHQASFDAPRTQRHFESSTTLHYLGPIPHLSLPFRVISYSLAAWRLWHLKQCMGIEVTISNLWGADLISILSGGADRKIALCHTNIVGNSTNRLMLKFLPLVGAIYRRFDKVIAVSKPLVSEVKSIYKLEECKTLAINNFIEKGAKAPSYLPNSDRIRFVWCGRFSPEKNLEGLLYAWAEAVKLQSKLQLLLLGDGVLFQQIKQLAHQLRLKIGCDPADEEAQIVFVGKVKDPSLYIRSSRALLLSSIAEGVGLVILESLSLGIPVLASDCLPGGVRYALKGDGNCRPNRIAAEETTAGYLLPVPNPDAPLTLHCWRDAVLTVATDDVLVNRWRQGAFVRAMQFSSAIAMEKWKAVLFSE